MDISTKCPRCSSTMFTEKFYDKSGDSFVGIRCSGCGLILDALIIKNRIAHREALRSQRKAHHNKPRPPGAKPKVSRSKDKLVRERRNGKKNDEQPKGRSVEADGSRELPSGTDKNGIGDQRPGVDVLAKERGVEAAGPEAGADPVRTGKNTRTGMEVEE